MPRYVAPILLLAACATDPHLSEDSDAITDEWTAYASQFQYERAIKTARGMNGGCTATRVGGRFALTAAHCLDNIMLAEVGDEVEFYRYGAFNPSGQARIEQRYARPDVNPDACYDDNDECYDDKGYFADIALLRLSANTESDLEYPQATLAWKYPGADADGDVVGNGRHNGYDNPNGSLRQANGETDWADDENGMFETDEAETDDGDSGGPFYVDNKVVGVLSGSKGFPSPDTYGRYTSVPFFIHWLLTKTGYQWRGQPPQADTVFNGDAIESSTNSHIACQYACEKTTECEAYDWRDSSNACWLYKNVTPADTYAGWTGALKGGRSGTSGDAVGFVRSDGVHSVVHVGTNGRIEQYALAGQWNPQDIQGSAPAPASRLTALRRADGINAVYYRSSNGDIIELALEGSTWNAYNLGNVVGATAAAGAPAAYVKADGVTAVVYRATNGHIMELRLGSRGWIARNLSIASGSSTVVATSDPSVSVRTGGLSSVVFRAGTHIWEYYQYAGESWAWGVPSQLTVTPSNPTPPPAADSRPVAYSHRGGIHAIVYRSGTNIVELWIAGGQWYWGILAGGAKGDPIAYTRTDGKEAVVFRNTSNQIMAATNSNGWATQNLTTLTGTATATSDPHVYHRADGYNSIVFENGNTVNEIYWKRGMANWLGGQF